MEKRSFLIVDVGGDLLDLFGVGRIGAHLFLHLIQRVKHRGVIPVAELLADVVEGEVCHPADQIHGRLPGFHQVPLAALSPDLLLIHVIIPADVLDDQAWRRHKLIVLFQHILHGTADGLAVHLVAQQIPIGQQLIQGALDLSNVGGEIFRDKAADIVGQLHPQQGSLVFDDGQPRLKVRGATSTIRPHSNRV